MFQSRCGYGCVDSLNIGHLEAIVHILHQSFITAVSRVCKPIPITNSSPVRHHLDTLNRNPVWIIVYDRNPTYISWDSSPKGFKFWLQQLLTLARSSTTLKPSSIILIFSNGLYNTFVRQKLWEEFGASEIELDFYVFDFYFSDDSDSEWVNVLGRLYKGACVLEIKVDDDITVLSAEFDVKGSTITTVASVVPKLLELAGDVENNALLRRNGKLWQFTNYIIY